MRGISPYIASLYNRNREDGLSPFESIDSARILAATVLQKQQTKTVKKSWSVGTKTNRIVIKIRYDDQCGNGHNTFAMTADVYESRSLDRCGCCHGDIAEQAPELAKFLKWHLCSTDGPMHYVANTVFHAQNGDIDFARLSAIWPDSTVEQLEDKKMLMQRLPALMNDFRSSIEELGFTY